MFLNKQHSWGIVVTNFGKINFSIKRVCREVEFCLSGFRSRSSVYCPFFNAGRLFSSVSSFYRPEPDNAVFMASAAIFQVMLPSAFVPSPLPVLSTPIPVSRPSLQQQTSQAAITVSPACWTVPSGSPSRMMPERRVKSTHAERWNRPSAARDVEAIEQRSERRTEEPVAEEIGREVHQNGGMNVTDSDLEEEGHCIVGCQEQPGEPMMRRVRR